MQPITRFWLILLTIIILFVLVFTPLALAQTGSSDYPESWGEFLNPDGSINWANLSYVGDVSEPADWMSVEVLDGIQVPLGEATYSRYITPSGNVLVLPSPATLFMTFLHPEELGINANTPEMLGTGHQVLAMLAGDYLDLADLQAMGYVDPAAFFQAVIEGRENIWSLLSFNFLRELAHMTIKFWLYRDDLMALPERPVRRRPWRLSGRVGIDPHTRWTWGRHTGPGILSGADDRVRRGDRDWPADRAAQAGGGWPGS